MIDHHHLSGHVPALHRTNSKPIVCPPWREQGGDNYDDDDDGDDDDHDMDNGRSASHDVNIRDGAAGENEKKEAEEASDQPHPLIFCTRPLSYICQRSIIHPPWSFFRIWLSPFQSVVTLHTVPKVPILGKIYQ